MKDIYVTGVGIECSLGRNYREYIHNVFHNPAICHHTPIKRRLFRDGSKTIRSFVGVIKGNQNYNSVLSNNYHYLCNVCDEALKNAGSDLRGRNVALCIGTLLGGEKDGEVLDKRIAAGKYDASKDRSKFNSRSLCSLADRLIKRYHLHNLTCFVISTACSASNDALILGSQLLERGYDVALCAGVDELANITIAGFNSLGAYNKKRSLQAFCRKSSGLSTGEGAGAIVLQKKAKHPLAKILGGALTSDAYHITSPEPTGRIARRAVVESLRQAGVPKESVNYVNAHGTGTFADDEMEINLLSNLFTADTLISSTKGFTGHTLGAAGIIETINCIASIQNHKCLGTHVDSDLEKFTKNDLPSNFIINDVKNQRVTVAVNLSFAFGGNNSSLVIGAPYSPYHSFSKVRYQDHGLYIRGYGSTFSNHDFTKHYQKLNSKEVPINGYNYIPPMRMLNVNPRIYIRLDNYSKMVANVMGYVINQHDLGDPSKIGIVFSTATGPTKSVSVINDSIPKYGYDMVPAITFPFTVMNAAVGSVSQLFHIQGPVSAFSANGTGFVDSIKYAHCLLDFQDLNYVFVISGNQFNKYSLMKDYEYGCTKTDRPTDGCCVFLVSKNNDKNGVRIVDSYQDKFNVSNVSDALRGLQNDLKHFLLKNGVPRGVKIPTFVNLNNCYSIYGRALRKLLSTDRQQDYDLVSRCSDLGFNTAGGGEEAIRLLAQTHSGVLKGLNLDIEFSNMAGFAFVLLKSPK